MATSAEDTAVRTEGHPAPPPMRPDPALVDNAEGNKRILRKDREALQKVVDELDRAEKRKA